jgi:hypothetical protein
MQSWTSPRRPRPLSGVAHSAVLKHPSREGNTMALVALPDGQSVDKDLVQAVQSHEAAFGGFEVRVLLKASKGNEERYVTIECETKEEMKDMLKRVNEALGVGRPPAGPVVI